MSVWEKGGLWVQVSSHLPLAQLILDSFFPTHISTSSYKPTLLHISHFKDGRQYIIHWTHFGVTSTAGQ